MNEFVGQMICLPSEDQIILLWEQLSGDATISSAPSTAFVSFFESIKSSLQVNPVNVLATPFGGAAMKEYRVMLQPTLVVVLNAKPKEQGEAAAGGAGEASGFLDQAVKVFTFSTLLQWRVEGKTVYVVRNVASVHASYGFTFGDVLTRLEFIAALRESFDSRMQMQMQLHHTPQPLMSIGQRAPTDRVNFLPAEIRDLIFGKETLQVLGIVRSVCKR